MPARRSLRIVASESGGDGVPSSRVAGGVAGVGDWVGVGWASPSPQCSLSVTLAVGGVVSDDVASGGGGGGCWRCRGGCGTPSFRAPFVGRPCPGGLGTGGTLDEQRELEAVVAGCSGW